jgi:hypothetical protein
MALGDVKISVQNLFKIYGHNPRAVQDRFMMASTKQPSGRKRGMFWR